MQCERASGETCLFIWTFVKCPPPLFFPFFFATTWLSLPFHLGFSFVFAWCFACDMTVKRGSTMRAEMRIALSLLVLVCSLPSLVCVKYNCVVLCETEERAWLLVVCDGDWECFPVKIGVVVVPPHAPTTKHNTTPPFPLPASKIHTTQPE